MINCNSIVLWSSQTDLQTGLQTNLQAVYQADLAQTGLT